MSAIGIRREDKNRWERRVPITPHHVEELVHELGLEVIVEPSARRIFEDEEYAAAGARLSDDLSAASLILGVKEIPAEKLPADKAAMCFWHVIKGQSYNMPLLRSALDASTTMIDYEPIVDRFGRRLIFFGRHAGYAGMIDSLAALGRRLTSEGLDTPWKAVRPAYEYRNVEEATRFLAEEVGRRIREHGVSRQLHPLVVGFTGGGNVSGGAQEVLDRLPMVEVVPDDLPELFRTEDLSRRAVYKVVFRRDHRRRFARHLPYLTVLINGIYWEPGDPRVISREDLRGLWKAEKQPRLRVIGDLSCDVEGSIEATARVTTPDEPVFVYDPETGEATDGVEGRGPVVLAVDNLPAEFPRDASEHFGDSLFPFLSALGRANFSGPFEHLHLPAAILPAVVAHGGELSPTFRYLDEHLQNAGA